MDREYLKDYEQGEQRELERLLKNIREGKFSFDEDRFPPNERFIKLQRPVALASPLSTNSSNLWAQIPFSGSLIIYLPPFQKHLFEQYYCKVSEIPRIIDFIKETGKLQVALIIDIHAYEGLDHLDPFFELKPPLFRGTPVEVFGDKKEIKKFTDTFFTLGAVRYIDFLRELSHGWIPFPNAVRMELSTYLMLKLERYPIVEEIENYMIDDPKTAHNLFYLCRSFIVNPIVNLRTNLSNFTLEETKEAQTLPLVYQPREIQFPCEIGKFLLKKLTYAPQGLRACNEIIDEYASYDLQKVLESLNDAIIANHPDILNKNSREFSEILDNIWKDPTIPRRVKGLKVGIPLSIAAIGGLASGPVGAAAGGFLADLGYKLAEKTVSKFFDVKSEGVSEKLAKLRTKNYQANIYDFKKKYKAKITHQ